MAYDKDLPDELQEGPDTSVRRQLDPEAREARLARLGQAIAEKRQQAIAARRESGIEKVWTYCEEAYQKIDDSNRHEFAGARWTKPMTPAGPLTSTATSIDETKSTAFVPLTTRYVDMAYAKISEIALPIDDKAFSFKQTPVAELVDQMDSTAPAVHPVTGQAAPAMPGPDGQPVQMTMGDVAKAVEETAATAAEKAEKRVWDWLVECNYPSEARKMLHDAARIGVGVIKGPFPDMQTNKALEKGPNGTLKLTIVQKSVPAAKWIDAWNLFPDGACGEDIHSGNHIFERDFISETTLKALKNAVDAMGQPIYLADQIDQVIGEGPDKCNVNADNTGPADKKNKDRYTIWYFTGALKRSDMDATDAVGLDELPDELDEVYAVVTVVNDTVIRATLNPLESGEFPYRAFPWSRRAGHWAGVGVGEQVMVAQKIVNAGTRSWMNNAGWSSGVLLLMLKEMLTPADGSNTITPNKIYYVDSDLGDARKALTTIEIPNRGKELQDIVQYGFKLAEEASNIPLLSQGQTSEQAPDTFGQSELQDTNANALLRSLGLRLDDYVTGPLVNGFYEMLLLDPDVPEDEKGDFKIMANGTIAMVEKAIQERTLLGVANMALNPAYGLDPEKAMEEVLRSKRLDPRKLQLTDQQKQAMASRPPPVDPRIAAANIAAKATMYRADKERDRDTEFVQAQSQRDENQHAETMYELQLRKDVALLEMANTQKITLEEAKAQLAGTAMKLNVQKELSANALAVDLHKHHNPTPNPLDAQALTPPTEPVGKAPAGQAFAA